MTPSPLSQPPTQEGDDDAHPSTACAPRQSGTGHRLQPLPGLHDSRASPQSRLHLRRARWLRHRPTPEHGDTSGVGLDHGAGHSLLLLYDAKVPRGQKSKEFNDLGHNPSNASISLFYIMTKYFIFITI